jgi:hypothetical protein
MNAEEPKAETENTEKNPSVVFLRVSYLGFSAPGRSFFYWSKKSPCWEKSKSFYFAWTHPPDRA